MAKWISVKDRLPEKFEVCIVCGKNGSVHIRSFAKEYGFFDTYKGLDGDTHIGNEHMEKNLITHWMPLPEPPKVALENVIDLDEQTKANNSAMRKVIDFITEG